MKKITMRDVAKMTDAERDTWRKSLTNSEWDKINGRTYREVEYQITSYDADGNDDCDFYGSLEEAKTEYQRTVDSMQDFGIVAIKLEKVVSHFCALVDNLEDRQWTMISSVGDCE